MSAKKSEVVPAPQRELINEAREIIRRLIPPEVQFDVEIQRWMDKAKPYIGPLRPPSPSEHILRARAQARISMHHWVGEAAKKAQEAGYATK
jgi:hypothetical protein